MLPKLHNGGGVCLTVPAARFDDTSMPVWMEVLLSSRSLCDDPSGLPVRAGTIPTAAVDCLPMSVLT